MKNRHTIYCGKKNGSSTYNNEFVFGTKSQLSGDFSDYFKNIFYKLFDEKQQNSIKERLINNNSSMIFEVISIYHNEKKVVLPK